MFNISDINSAAIEVRSNIDSKRHSGGNLMHGGRGHSRGGCDSYEIMKHAMTQKQWGPFERPDSFDASDEYHSQDLSLKLYQREEISSKRSDLVSFPTCFIF